MICDSENLRIYSKDGVHGESGYSPDPDVARSQILVLLAKKYKNIDLEELRQFDLVFFRSFWIDLRRVAFNDIQANFATEMISSSLVVKDRFEKLSDYQKRILLLFAGALASEKQETKIKGRSTKPDDLPFDVSKNQQKHPFKYIPYTKLVYVFDEILPQIEQFIKGLSVDDYEFRRIVGAFADTPRSILDSMIMLDAEVTAYCLVTASVMRYEPEFIGCGVWRKLTEYFEKRNMKMLSVIAHAVVTGMIGGARGAYGEEDLSKSSAFVLNMIQQIRGSARSFLVNNGDDCERLLALLAGTTVMRHILNHPKFRGRVVGFLMETIELLDPILDEIKSGELIAWAEQDKLII